MGRTRLGIAVFSLLVVSGFSRTIQVVSGFPSTLLGTGSRTSAQAPKAEMTRVPQFENDRAVSWKSVIPAHTESTFHRHDRYRTVIGIVGGDLTTIDPQGKKTVMHYETGKSVLAGADARGRDAQGRQRNRQDRSS